MSDMLTEVTSQSWIGRLMESIKGVAVGLLLFLVAFPLLFWNEGRAVKTARSLSEGAAAVVTVAPDTVNAGNEGKLVHLTTEATTSETLSDATFGISLNALKLRRQVEMYQWQESKGATTETKKLGGSVEKTTKYNYAPEWSATVTDSSKFKDPTGHTNPATMAVSSASQQAKKITAGAFTLSPALVAEISASEALPVGETDLAKVDATLRPTLKVANNQLTTSADPAKPQVGDLRITFRAAKPQTVSLVARQIGQSFEPYTTSNGQSVQLLSVGTHSSAEMFAQAQAKNSTTTWILRVVGFALMLFGLLLICKPLVVVADVVPIMGDLLGAGLFAFAFLIAAGLSLTTIAIGWIVYRPLLGIGLLVVAGGAAFLLVRLAKQRKAAKAPKELVTV